MKITYDKGQFHATIKTDNQRMDTIVVGETGEDGSLHLADAKGRVDQASLLFAIGRRLEAGWSITQMLHDGLTALDMQEREWAHGS